jgi:hypothetical protein
MNAHDIVVSQREMVLDRLIVIRAKVKALSLCERRGAYSPLQDDSAIQIIN